MADLWDTIDFVHQSDEGESSLYTWAASGVSAVWGLVGGPVFDTVALGYTIAGEYASQKSDGDLTSRDFAQGTAIVASEARRRSGHDPTLGCVDNCFCY